MSGKEQREMQKRHGSKFGQLSKAKRAEMAKHDHEVEKISNPVLTEERANNATGNPPQKKN